VTSPGTLAGAMRHRPRLALLVALLALGTERLFTIAQRAVERRSRLEVSPPRAIALPST